MEDLSSHILDIAENSITAGCSLLTIKIIEDRGRDLLCLVVRDNGAGVPPDILDEIMDPFCTTRTTRRVGLGLPLLAQAAQETGGQVTLRSRSGRGTTVIARFRPSHIDMKPMGNITDTVITLIAGNPHTDIVFSYRRDAHVFCLDTRQIRAGLDGVPLNAAPVLSFLRTYLSESLGEKA